MRLFDLHCDTAGECYNKKIPLAENDLHISLCKGKALDEWCQVFAIWILDELRGKKAYDYFVKVLENHKNEINKNADKIKLCQQFSDIDEAVKNGKCAALTAVEGGSPFAEKDVVFIAKEHGVKLITLTWNGENELGYGCQSGVDSGLKECGKTLLRSMCDMNIVADVSHLNRAGFYDAVSSGARVIASHSNCEKVLLKTRKDSEDKFFSCRRSLNDEQIKILIECGGLIGINFCKSFLGDNGDDGFEAVYRHMAHILDLGGENVLAIGSDFDGCDINPELSGIDKIENLNRFLADKGMDSVLLDKIFFSNSQKFFKNILQE
ncbi:MAG: membrane dipeptidase [Clostridia bacterium]|nr:membrane dipeptidase [Clostridia bacterium]